MHYFNERLIFDNRLLTDPLINTETHQTIHRDDSLRSESYYDNYLIRTVVGDVTSYYGSNIPGIRDQFKCVDVPDRTSEEAINRFKCPISLTYMENPVVAPDGHTYEEALITAWLAENQTSPMTGLNMPDGIPVPHELAAQLIDDINQERVAFGMQPHELGLGRRTVKDILVAFKDRFHERLQTITDASNAVSMITLEGGAASTAGTILTTLGHPGGGASAMTEGTARASLSPIAAVSGVITTASQVPGTSLDGTSSAGQISSLSLHAKSSARHVVVTPSPEPSDESIDDTSRQALSASPDPK